MNYIREDELCIFFHSSRNKRGKKDSLQICKEDKCDGHNGACELYCENSYTRNIGNGTIKDFSGIWESIK